MRPLLALLTLALTANVVNATIVFNSLQGNCSGASIPAGNGSASITCPDAVSVGVPVGSALLSVVLNEQVNYMNGSNGTNTVRMTWFAPPIFAFSPNPAVAVVTGTVTSTGPGSALQTSLASLSNFLSSFTVSIVSTVTSGSVGQSDAGELIGVAGVSSQSPGLTNVTYNFSYSVPDSTPEPAAVVIMVVGLLCIAVGRCRRHLS
jgi:hypothetical protein